MQNTRNSQTGRPKAIAKAASISIPQAMGLGFAALFISLLLSSLL